MIVSDGTKLRRFTRKKLHVLTLGVLGLTLSQSVLATPDTTELQNYLVIATGQSGVTFNFDGGELGANQEVVSSGTGDQFNGDPLDPNTTGQIHDSFTSIGIDLTGTFVPQDGETVFDNDTDNRFTDADPDNVDRDNVNIPDFLPGARPLLERPDYSGNVALTGNDASFVSENVDYFASIGIQCADDDVRGNGRLQCHDSFDGDNSFKSRADTDFETLDTGSGVSNFDPTALLSEIDQWRLFVEGLDAEFTITDDIENISFKEYDSNRTFAENQARGDTPLITDLDAIDTDGDGFAVIDIDAGDNFLVNNSDWILNSVNDVTAIFRLTGQTTSVNFDNSSISLGPGCLELDANGFAIPQTTCEEPPITELGAIFVADRDDRSANTNEVFNLNNVILGGIGLFDLDERENTILNLNNVQGCAQFIGSTVQFSSTERFNRCALTASTTPPPPGEVPEPASFALFGLGILGWQLTRRRQG
jgi:hypothetical protein